MYWAKHGRPLSYEKLLQNMEKISKRVQRIDSIIQSMRQAAVSSSSIKSERIRIHALIEEALDILAPEIHKNAIVVERVFSPLDIEVKFLSTQFVEVVINLVSNAIHALEKEEGERVIWIETTQEKDRVLIRVIDNGPGVPLVKEKYLFEPFFTTHPGVGTGIGLYLVKRLLSFYHGSITYHRKESKTEFEIVLPSLEA